MIEEFIDILDAIIDYFSDLGFPSISISDQQKRYLRYLRYFLKIGLAIYILAKTIPKVSEFGAKYTSTTNGPLKIAKAILKFIISALAIYFMFTRGPISCPPCPECDQANGNEKINQELGPNGE